MIRSNQFLVVAALAGILLGSCRNNVAQTIRRVTYPPDFSYITSEQIDPAMRQMAREIRELDRLLRQGPGAPTAGDRPAEVLGHLKAIDEAAGKLERQTGWNSNHPGISANLSRFRSDVQNARRLVDNDPPNYFLAGSISGACLYCHANGPD